jgi:hypothetical protein
MERNPMSPTNGWSPGELDRIGNADELTIAPSRPDGSLYRFTTIWVVRMGDDLYVRSHAGRSGHWFRHALERHEGRIRAGGVDRDVGFEEPQDADQSAVSDAYRRKYARYGPAYVDPMVSDAAAAATLRLVPR